MESGVFEVGETVKGELVGATPVTDAPAEGTNSEKRYSITPSVNPSILFRVAQQNHKSGPFDQPTKVYDRNPYDSINTGGNVSIQGFEPLPTNYTAAATILNVDTTSLSKHSEGDFVGYIRPAMVLRGQTSGVVATVDKWLDISESAGITHLTLFVKYINANNNNEAESFDDGEVLIVEENFTYGNTTTVNSGESVASLIDENATALGTAVGVTEGVFFVRGTFVYVPTEKLVLDAYSNSSSYRVGFTVLEELVTAKDDDSLALSIRSFRRGSSCLFRAEAAIVFLTNRLLQ